MAILYAKIQLTTFRSCNFRVKSFFHFTTKRFLSTSQPQFYQTGSLCSVERPRPSPIAALSLSLRCLFASRALRDRQQGQSCGVDDESWRPEYLQQTGD